MRDLSSKPRMHPLAAFLLPVIAVAALVHLFWKRHQRDSMACTCWRDLP